MSHTMPQQDRANLIAMMGIEPGSPGFNDNEEFPDAKLEAKYWELKRCGDRVSSNPTLRDLVWLAAACGYGKEATPKEAAGASLAAMWNNREVAYGTAVDGLWRGKPVSGKFQGCTGDGQKVKVDIDGDVREIPTNDVWLAGAKSEAATGKASGKGKKKAAAPATAAA